MAISAMLRSEEKDRKALEKRVAIAALKVVVLGKVIAIANKEYNTDLKKSWSEVIAELKGSRATCTIENLCEAFGLPGKLGITILKMPISVR